MAAKSTVKIGVKGVQLVHTAMERACHVGEGIGQRAFVCQIGKNGTKTS